MELPALGWFLVPVVVWLSSAIALGIALRGQGAPRLLLRVATVFLALWAVLATTALVWLVVHGGWPAIQSLAQQPPDIFSGSAIGVWVLGAIGAFGVLLVAFLVNQLVGRGILRICGAQRLAWPPRLAELAGETELRRFASPSAEAFSFTLLDRTGGHWRRREIILLSDGLWESLEPAEREAVIAHELGHVLDLDSRYLTFFRTFARLMRWDPVLGYLARRVTHSEEFQADDAAVAATHEPLALARALFKAISLPAPRSGSRGPVGTGFLGVGGEQGRRDALERIRRLVQRADAEGRSSGVERA